MRYVVFLTGVCTDVINERRSEEVTGSPKQDLLQRLLDARDENDEHLPMIVLQVLKLGRGDIEHHLTRRVTSPKNYHITVLILTYLVSSAMN